MPQNTATGSLDKAVYTDPMNFDQYINDSWAKHATETQAVFASFDSAQDLMTTNDHIPILARLIAHVCGDHLAAWDVGSQKLLSLKQHSLYQPKTESEFALDRLSATLQLSAGQISNLQDFSRSDQARIYAQAAGMLSAHEKIETAQKYLEESLKLASTGLDTSDPAYRSLAITGNNLACTLEEKMDRSAAEVDLMILAAQTGRKFWELAGGPTEIATAEYRVSQSYLQAKKFEKSLEHAKLCLKSCEQYKGPALDYFFAYEAIALAEKSLGHHDLYENAVIHLKTTFEKLSDDDKKWCQKTVSKF